MTVVDVDPYAETKLRLKTDFPFYAATQLQIVDKQQRVPFHLKPAQARLWDALERQRAEGKPGRVLVLKARKIGFSTMAQGMILQRVTQRPNHNSLTVAQDNKTAQELFSLAEGMYSHLSEHPAMKFLKPSIAHRRRQRELIFGEDSRQRLAGNMGLNSKMLVDTAGEFEAGRGFTFHTLHLSEAALWPDLRRKLTSLLNTVPQDDPDTLIVIESTAKGFNYFKELWDAAEAGDNDYIPFFSAWFEDARYVRKFISPDEQADLEANLGSGPWGEDEMMLLDLIQTKLGEWTDLPKDAVRQRTIEHLNWRRWAIENLSGRDVQDFNQEYPSLPAMAFATTGRNVFAPLLVQEAAKKAEETDPQAEEVTLETTKTVLRRGRHVSVDVPTEFRERKRDERSRSDLYWRIWDRPKPKGQYVVVVDPAAGAENTSGEPDWTAIQVLDHIDRVQVAELQSRADPDLLAEQAYLICMMYSVKPNLPLLVVEMTGGYGTSIADRVYKEYQYRRMYARKPIDPRRREAHSDLIGFSTDRHTKPRLVDGMKELLRERSHGIRSLRLIRELETYERVKSGKTQAAQGAHDDLLMAYMVAQYVAQERPPRKDRRPGDVVNMATRAVKNPRLGY